MIRFPENVQTDGWKDGQTLLYRILQATAGGRNMNDSFKKNFSVHYQLLLTQKVFFPKNLQTFAARSFFLLSRFWDILFLYDLITASWNAIVFLI